MLADPERVLLIGDRDGEPVGQVRFDRLLGAGGRWEISVTAAPAVRGRGAGRGLIAAGVAWLWDAEPDARAIEAWVRPGNERSLHAFAACGFELAGPERDGLVRLALAR